MSKCQNCGAPGGYPYCNEDCREAATAPEVPVSTSRGHALASENIDPWASDARNYQ